MVHVSDRPACSFCCLGFGITASCIDSYAEAPSEFEKGWQRYYGAIPALAFLGPAFLFLLGWKLLAGPVSIRSCPFIPQQSRAGSVTWMRPPRRAQVLPGEWGYCLIIRSHSAFLCAPAVSAPGLELRGAWLSCRMRHHFNAECFSAQPGLIPQGRAEMFTFTDLP